MTIWDVVMYWREADLMRARRALWAGHDYRLVALVGDRTFRGGHLGSVPSPPADEIVHTVLDAGEDWAREHQQRNAAYRLRRQMRATDLVLMCDADEIVDPDRLDAILEATERSPAKLGMGMWYYGTRWRAPQPWTHPAACRAAQLPKRMSEDLRNVHTVPVVPTAGWHLSYLHADDTDSKLSAFAHAELDMPHVRSALNLRRLTGVDPHGVQLLDDPLTGPLLELL